MGRYPATLCGSEIGSRAYSQIVVQAPRSPFTRSVLGRRQMSAHSATALGRCATRLLSCIAAFPLQLASRAPKHNLSSAGVKHADGYLALQEIACIATAQPGPRRCNLRLGCIADIPAALQRRNAPETWLTPCVALADLTEALVQCKVIFCNIHTSWLQGLVSVARGPAALGWPQAACLIHGGRGIFMKPRLADGVHE